MRSPIDIEFELQTLRQHITNSSFSSHHFFVENHLHISPRTNHVCLQVQPHPYHSPRRRHSIFPYRCDLYDCCTCQTSFPYVNDQPDYMSAPGSIAGYNNVTCSGSPVLGETASDGTTVVANPEYNTWDQCLTFNTPADLICVDYGSYRGIHFYSDPHCTPEDVLLGGNATNLTQFSQKQDFNGGNIGSFSFFPERPDLLPGGSNWPLFHNELTRCDVYSCEPEICV